MQDMTDDFLDGVPRIGRTVLALVYYAVIVFFLLLILRTLPSLKLPSGFFDVLNVVLAGVVGISLLYLGLIGFSQARERGAPTPWYKKLVFFAGIDLLVLAFLALLAQILPDYAWLTTITLIVLAIPLGLFFCWLVLFASEKALKHLENEAEEQRAVIQAKRQEEPGRPLTQKLTRGEKVRGLNFLVVILLIVGCAVLIWLNLAYHFLDAILVWAFLGFVYGFLYLNAGLRTRHNAYLQGQHIPWYRQHDLVTSLAGFLFGLFIVIQYILLITKVDLANWQTQTFDIVCVAIIAALIIASSLLKRLEQREHLPA